jgi:phosphogluconate dehydratase
MSGASGSIPAAIHVCPEAVNNGPIGKIMDGDIITLNAVNKTLEVAADLSSRTSMVQPHMLPQRGFGRTLFTSMRQHATIAEAGAGITLLETK